MDFLEYYKSFENVRNNYKYCIKREYQKKYYILNKEKLRIKKEKRKIKKIDINNK